MIGFLRTRVHKQPIIALYFEFENDLKFYNLNASYKPSHKESGEVQSGSFRGWRNRIYILWFQFCSKITLRLGITNSRICLVFFIVFFKKKTRSGEHYQSVKRFGSRSRSTFFEFIKFQKINFSNISQLNALGSKRSLEIKWVKVNLWSWVGPTSPICCKPCPKFINLLGLEKTLKFFFHYIWAWRPSWSCDQNTLNKLSKKYAQEICTL